MLDSLGNKSYKPNPRLARALDILFILHAEHEMNCSTAAVRHLASSGVDVFTALSGGVGALYGPLHGGANEVNHIEHCSPLRSCIQNFLHVSAAIRN
jgi:citrate synthase